MNQDKFNQFPENSLSISTDLENSVLSTMKTVITDHELSIYGLDIHFTLDDTPCRLTANPAETVRILHEIELIKDYVGTSPDDFIIFLEGIVTTPDLLGTPIHDYFNPEWTWQEFVSEYSLDQTDAKIIIDFVILEQKINTAANQIRSFYNTIQKIA
jgi:hypothetical protein